MAAPSLEAMVSLPARTMSTEEVRQSSVLAGLDVVLFFALSVMATRYWLETRARLHEVQRLHVDVDALRFRCLVLQLLSASNALRAIGIVLDANCRLLLKHKHIHAWRWWLDYLISSLPTLVWCSMLSALLMYLVEAYHRTQLRHCTWVRPIFLGVNVILYALYALLAVVTFRPAYYGDFRRFAYFLLACAHASLAVGLLRYGCGLACRLSRMPPRRRVSPTAAQVAVQHASLAGDEGLGRRPANRLLLLSILLPATELVRTSNDLEYSLGGLPFNLDTGIASVIFLAGAKLFLEWVPSVVIFITFRPRGGFQAPACSPVNDGYGQRWVDPLLPPSRCVAAALPQPAPWLGGVDKQSLLRGGG